MPSWLLLLAAAFAALALLPRGADAAAPVLSSSTLNYTCSENTTLQVAADNGLLSNASDADSDPLTVAVVAGPSSGATAVTANSGAFNYTPNGAFSGVDSWTFEVSDGLGGTVQGTAYITVLAANKNPALNATSLNFTTAENITLSVAAASGLLSIAYDPEGGSLNVTAATPTSGTVVVNTATGAFNYTPGAAYSGLDSFTFTVTDVDGGSVQGTVYVQVTAANKNPRLNATSLNFTTAENTTLSVAAASGLLSIAYDPEGGSLNVTAGTPSSGTVVVNTATGAFNYTPGAAYSGLDSFTFTVTDVDGGSVQGTVYVQVTAANKNPALNATSLNFTTAENTTLSVAAASGLLSIAYDPEGGSLNVTAATPTSGTVVVNTATGAFNYTPGAAYSGLDSFTFTVTDVDGGSVQGTVYVQVTAANKNPALNATSLNFTTAENTTLSVAAASGLLSIAYDPEGGSLNVTAATPSSGTVVVNTATGAFNYTPGAAYSGLDSFTFTVTDVDGGSVQGTVYVQVTAANKNPRLNATSLNFTTAENTTLSVAAASGLLSIAYDPDGGSLNVTAGTPSSGTVVVNAATGAFNYTPTATYSGLDSFTFTVTDVDGGSVQGTVYVQITAANKNPRLNATSLNFTTSENATLSVAAASGLLSIAYDPEGGSLNVTAGTPSHGAVVVNTVTGAFNYTPTAAYSGQDSFTFTVTDVDGGTVQGTVYVKVIGANHAPVLNPANRTFTTVENTTLSVASGQGLLSTATDSDGDTLRVNTSAVSSGTVVVNALTGAFNYTPDASFVGLANFTYTVFDGLGGEVSGFVTINVTAPPPNNPPVLNPINRTFTTVENTTLSIAAGQGLLSTATDADGDTLRVNTSTPSAGGTVVVNELTGAFNYTPANAYTGVEVFSYVVFDSRGGEAVGYVLVNVTAPPPNQPPVLNPATINVTTAVNVTLSVSAANGLLRNASDPDGDPLTASAATQPSNGAVTVAGNGSFVYTPNPDFTGDDSFNFTVSDNRGGTATGVVYIFVSAVNRPPVLDPSTLNYTTLEDTPLVVSAASGLLSTATDPDNNRMSVVIDTRPGSGNVSRLNATTGAFTYYPAPNFFGEVNFTFNVTDGAGGVAQGIAYVTVVSVPDPPVVVSRTRNYTVNESATLIVAANQGLLVGATDPEGGPLNVIATDPVPSGTLDLNSADGSFTFTPDPDFFGRVSFNYTITSEASGASVDGMSFIRVLNVNNAPVLDPDTLNFTATQGVRLIVSAAQGLLSTASDLDNDTLTVVITKNPTHGTITGLVARTGAFNYMPAAFFAGEDTFTFAVRDPAGQTANGTAYIHVAGVPYVARGKPVNIFFSAGRNVETDIPAPGVLVNVLHGENATLTATLVAQPAGGGNVTLNGADGSFTFASAAVGPRIVFFRVNISDPSGGFLIRGVTITIGAPALAAPTVDSFQLSCAVFGPMPRCRWALLTTLLTAGSLDVISGDPPGAPNGMEVQFVAPSGRTCGWVRLPGPIAAGAVLSQTNFGCPRCGRCITRLGIQFGQPVGVRVRARASRGYHVSPFSSPDFNVTFATPSAAAVAAAKREMAKSGGRDN